jgi:ABC-type Fe3+-hydroxamate transport system substrate-binding protein
MLSFIDQTGHEVVLGDTPTRIISLVPSQTELLFDLGLEKEVAGITKFCIHPEKWFRSKPRVGGTKQVKTDIIHQLEPDLIIANKEENVKEQIEELAGKYPVWTSDIHNLEEALVMIRDIGLITGKQAMANRIAEQIAEGFTTLTVPGHRFRTAYLIWKDPYMTVGNDTFIHCMMETAGFDNVFSERKRYPAISTDDLKKSGCELLLLSSEPYPFRQKHMDELQHHLPAAKIILADGEMFSWYGSRLLKAPAYFTALRNQLK